jgi:hypothetical protein
MVHLSSVKISLVSTYSKAKNLEAYRNTGLSYPVTLYLKILAKVQINSWPKSTFALTTTYAISIDFYYKVTEMFHFTLFLRKF